MSAIGTGELPAEALGLSGRLEDGRHRMWLRVYYEDTDAGGIVYHANYLRFAERARTEMLRLLGLHQRSLMAEEGLGFVVKDCGVDFRRPARLDDVLEVRSRLIGLGRVQCTFEQRIMLAESERDCVVLRVRVGCIDRGGRPARVAARALEAFKPFFEDVE